MIHLDISKKISHSLKSFKKIIRSFHSSQSLESYLEFINESWLCFNDFGEVRCEIFKRDEISAPMSNWIVPTVNFANPYFRTKHFRVDLSSKPALIFPSFNQSFSIIVQGADLPNLLGGVRRCKKWESLYECIFQKLSDIETYHQKNKMECLEFLETLVPATIHEIKNPLQLIKNIDAFHNNQEASKAISHIEESVQEVLTLGKNIGMELSSLYLNEFLVELAEYYNKLGIPVFLQANEDVFVKTNKASLYHIIDNLIQNAIAFQEEKFKIEIQIKSLFSCVEIWMINNGKPIEQSIQRNIFEPYVSVSPKGNGLGLFYTKYLLNKMNGSIQLEYSNEHSTAFKICMEQRK